MTGEKPEKEPWLNYKFQPFPIWSFDAILTMELLAAKFGHAFFSLKPFMKI
jgi:hypothetical protein